MEDLHRLRNAEFSTNPLVEIPDEALELLDLDESEPQPPAAAPPHRKKNKKVSPRQPKSNTPVIEEKPPSPKQEESPSSEEEEDPVSYVRVDVAREPFERKEPEEKSPSPAPRALPNTRQAAEPSRSSRETPKPKFRLRGMKARKVLQVLVDALLQGNRFRGAVCGEIAGKPLGDACLRLL